MMRVCKRWARVALTEPVGFWTEFAVVKRLMLPMQERDWLAGRLRQLGRMAPLVRAFSAPAWRKLHDASAASGLTLSHFLEALDPASLMSLDLDLGLGSDAAVQLLPNFSCLDTLVLRDAEAPATPLVVASLADRLRTLRCHSGELLSASMLGAVQQLSGLTRLELAAQELGTASLAPLVHLTTLRCLTVREEMREADFLGALELPLLAQMSQLTSYSLLSKREDGMKVGVRWAAPAPAHAAPGLSVQRRRGRASKVPAAFPAPVQVGGALLTGCSFTLGQHPSLGEVGVLFVRGVRQLESLDGTLDALLPAGKPLTLLELEHCQLTAQAMACCGRLAELPALDVNSCRLGGSVAAALEPLMRSTPKLEALTITGSLGLPNLPACVREKTGLKKLRLRQNALRDIMGGPFMHSERGRAGRGRLMRRLALQRGRARPPPHLGPSPVCTRCTHSRSPGAARHIRRQHVRRHLPTSHRLLHPPHGP